MPIVPLGAGAEQVIFITDVAPTSTGTVSNKNYEGETAPASKVLSDCDSDTDSVTVTFEVDATGNWQPGEVAGTAVTVYGGSSAVTVSRASLTQITSDVRRFQGTADIQATADTTIYAITADGTKSQDVSYDRLEDPPLITAAQFATHPDTTGGDPLVQDAQNTTTSLQGTQTVRVTGTAESHATKVWAVSQGVSSSEQGPFDVTTGAFDFLINVRSSGNTGAQTATVEAAVGVGGTRGASSPTSNTVTIDHVLPTFSSVGHSYPASQEALKDTETDTVTITHTNIASGDTYLYADNGTGELTIPATTTYAVSKAVQRLSGNYRESGTNYRLTVTRTEQNGTSASKSGTVKIAHTFPAVTVAKNSGGTALDRMGSGSGTKDRTVHLISSQANLSTHTPVLTNDAGDTADWKPASSWSAVTNLRYTRDYRVLDADIGAGGQASNNFSWLSCSLKNRAGKETTTIGTNPSYSLGGFTTRTINMGPITGGDPPYTHTGDVGVPIVDTSKTTVVNISKGGEPSQTYEGNVTEHNDADSSLNNYWTTVAALASESFDDFTQYFHCSDKKFYDSVTAPGGFNCTVAESET